MTAVPRVIEFIGNRAGCDSLRPCPKETTMCESPCPTCRGTGRIQPAAAEPVLPSLAERLRRAQPRQGPARHDTSGCPCRVENGGSGICGCIMGGITVTC